MGKLDARPLRSLLFTPGDQEVRIAQNGASGADALFLDLEEPRTPCPESVRVRARGLVREFLSDAPTGRDNPVYFVRVQPVASGMILRDVQAVMGPNLAGILLPKITGPADVYAADAILGCVETELGLPVGRTMLYPILENASAIRNAYDIAMASSRVAYMGGAVSRFGDIAGDIGFRWTRSGTETLFIREKVLIDARAAGIRYPISGMWGGANDDLDGLRSWLNELRDIGYFGMMLGNRDHVEMVNAAFTPTDVDVAYWRDVDRLARDAERSGEQVIYGDVNQGEGHEIHIAHVATARRLLTWAQELGVA
ncbi:MAG TPA: aldolase/citrate lyase family protein [Acidimicrobiia bacterium]|nr:aldolase/citrate lyase family protein [Acidimicrobiia bacterium]